MRSVFNVQIPAGHWSQGKNLFGNADLCIEARSFCNHWHLRYRKDCHEELFFLFPLRSHHVIFLKNKVEFLNLKSDFMHWQIRQSSSLCNRNIVIKYHTHLKVAIVPLLIPCCGSRWWFTLEKNYAYFLTYTPKAIIYISCRPQVSYPLSNLPWATGHWTFSLVHYSLCFL